MKNVIPTGFEALDEILGGGILSDGFLLVTYNTQSLGWTLAVKIFERLLNEENYFGIVMTYSLPFTMLKRYGWMMGLKIEDYLEMDKLMDKLKIVNVFHDHNEEKSKGGLEYPWPLDPSTFLPKISKAYLKLALGKDRVVGLNITLDGLADTLGEDVAIKIVRRGMALREVLPSNVPRPLSIMLLNKDRTSERFTSWVTHYSDHVIDFETTKGFIERVIVRKSLLPQFSPGCLLFRYGRGEIEIIRSPE